MKNELKAVLFDLGSTLLEYEKFEWPVIAGMGMNAGYEFLQNKIPGIPSIEKISGVFHRIFEEWRTERDRELIEINFKDLVTAAFKELNLPADGGFVFDFINAYYNPISEHVESIDGSANIVRKLKKRGFKIVVVSNSIFPANLHLEELRRFDILPYLDGMIFSCELGIKKPHPDIYLHALEIAGCTPAEAVFVGDRYLEDLDGPGEVGIKAILKRKPGREYPQEVEKFPMCDNISELSDLLGLDS